MDQLTLTAASGMRSRIESLELLANNISNAATTGYKADREFYGLYLSANANDSANGESAAARMPDIERNWIDFSQGVLKETNNPLDLALEGKGFFVVDSPTGALYTRNGNFRISKDGVLQTRDGYPVQAVGPNKTIRISPGQEGGVTVQGDGSVAVNGATVGRIALVDLAKPEATEKRGESYFRLVDTSYTPAEAQSQVHQGKLENSNVSPAESAVRLVNIMRQFEILQRAMSLGAEMNRKAVEEVAKV